MSAVTLVATRIALRLSVERRQYFVEGDGRRELEDGLSHFFFKEVSVKPELALATHPYPVLGVSFDLAIAEHFTNLEMVRRFGHNPKGWQFNGTKIVVPQTRKFKLVSIGAQPNFEAVKAVLAQHGTIPEGQWCDAFKKAFPQPDGKGSVGVADAVWVYPSGDAGFPYVGADGVPGFVWTVGGFDADWRWLVEMQA